MTTIKRTFSGPLTALACGALFVTLFLVQAAAVKAQWTTPDASQNINNTNTGNVGIGTTTPTALLEVKKNQNAGTTVTVDNPFTTAGHSAYSGFLFKQNGVNRLLVSSVNDNHSFIPSGTAQFWNFANGPTVFATNNTEQMRITSTGFVGIGTSAPDVKLQVHHSSANNVLANVGLPDLVLGLRNTSNTNGNMSVISFQDAGGYGTVNITAVQKDQVNHAADLLFLTRQNTTTLAERMRITSTGDIGVGTNTPGTKLHVAGGIYSSSVVESANNNGFRIVVSGPGDTRASWTYDGGTTTTRITPIANVRTSLGSNGVNDRLFLDLSGNVGVGTTTPGYKLDVQGGSINTSQNLCINGDCKSAWSQIASQWANGSGSINYGGGSVGIGITSPLYKLDVNGGTNGFRAKSSSALSTDTIATFENSSAIQVIVRANGNVGIGNTAPTEKLHVTGNFKVSGNIDVGGNINAKYQDVAEWVESSQELLPGTVVVLDSSKSNQVVASTQSYDSRVAGVISPRPGIALGERGEGRVLVAATGRVKVKVDAGNGPIQIGDLLVTSEKEGVAMKSMAVEIGGIRIHRPGTLIGKALEPLANGTGEILVLLSLQ